MYFIISAEQSSGLHARTEDIFLAAFLRGRKHNVEKAFICVSNTFPWLDCVLIFGIIFPTNLHSKFTLLNEFSQKT